MGATLSRTAAESTDSAQSIAHIQNTNPEKRERLDLFGNPCSNGYLNKQRTRRRRALAEGKTQAEWETLERQWYNENQPRKAALLPSSRDVMSTRTPVQKRPQQSFLGPQNQPESSMSPESCYHTPESIPVLAYNQVKRQPVSHLFDPPPFAPQVSRETLHYFRSVKQSQVLSHSDESQPSKDPFIDSSAEIPHCPILYYPGSHDSVDVPVKSGYVIVQMPDVWWKLVSTEERLVDSLSRLPCADRTQFSADSDHKRRGSPIQKLVAKVPKTIVPSILQSESAIVETPCPKDTSPDVLISDNGLDSRSTSEPDTAIQANSADDDHFMQTGDDDRDNQYESSLRDSPYIQIAQAVAAFGNISPESRAPFVDSDMTAPLNNLHAPVLALISSCFRPRSREWIEDSVMRAQIVMWHEAISQISRNERKVVSVGPLYLTEWLASYGARRIASVMPEAFAAEIVFVPMLVRNNHWAALTIIRDGEGYRYSVYNCANLAQYNQDIARLATDFIVSHAEVFNLEYSRNPYLQQVSIGAGDGWSCGLDVLYNLRYHLDHGQGVPDGHIYDIENFRLRILPELGFWFRNAVIVEDEAGNRALFEAQAPARPSSNQTPAKSESQPRKKGPAKQAVPTVMTRPRSLTLSQKGSVIFESAASSSEPESDSDDDSACDTPVPELDDGVDWGDVITRTECDRADDEDSISEVSWITIPAYPSPNEPDLRAKMGRYRLKPKSDVRISEWIETNKDRPINHVFSFVYNWSDLIYYHSKKPETRQHWTESSWARIRLYLSSAEIETRLAMVAAGEDVNDLPLDQNPCWDWNRRCIMQFGHLQGSRPGRRTKKQVRKRPNMRVGAALILRFMLAFNLITEGEWKRFMTDRRLELSHLCDKGGEGCCSPFHITLESQALNVDRSTSCFKNPDHWAGKNGRCTNPDHQIQPCLLDQKRVDVWAAALVWMDGLDSGEFRRLRKLSYTLANKSRYIRAGAKRPTKEVTPTVETKVWPCAWPDCTEGFETAKELQDHVIDHLRQRKPPSDRFACRWPGVDKTTGCNQDFDNPKELAAHVVEHKAVWLEIQKGKAKSEVFCNKCGFWPNGNGLGGHQKVHKFVCKKADCSEKFECLWELWCHVVDHLAVQDFSSSPICITCGMTWASPGLETEYDHLKGHIYRPSRERMPKPMACYFCGAHFDMASRFVKHMKRHRWEFRSELG